MSWKYLGFCSDILQWLNFWILFAFSFIWIESILLAHFELFSFGFTCKWSHNTYLVRLSSNVGFFKQLYSQVGHSPQTTTSIDSLWSNNTHWWIGYDRVRLLNCAICYQILCRRLHHNTIRNFQSHFGLYIVNE